MAGGIADVWSLLPDQNLPTPLFGGVAEPLTPGLLAAGAELAEVDQHVEKAERVVVVGVERVRERGPAGDVQPVAASVTVWTSTKENCDGAGISERQILDVVDEFLGWSPGSMTSASALKAAAARNRT